MHWYAALLLICSSVPGTNCRHIARCLQRAVRTTTRKVPATASRASSARRARARRARDPPGQSSAACARRAIADIHPPLRAPNAQWVDGRWKRATASARRAAPAQPRRAGELCARPTAAFALLATVERAVRAVKWVPTRLPMGRGPAPHARSIGRRPGGPGQQRCPTATAARTGMRAHRAATPKCALPPSRRSTTVAVARATSAGLCALSRVIIRMRPRLAQATTSATQPVCGSRRPAS